MGKVEWCIKLCTIDCIKDWQLFLFLFLPLYKSEDRFSWHVLDHMQLKKPWTTVSSQSRCGISLLKNINPEEIRNLGIRWNTVKTIIHHDNISEQNVLLKLIGRPERATLKETTHCNLLNSFCLSALQTNKTEAFYSKTNYTNKPAKTPKPLKPCGIICNGL